MKELKEIASQFLIKGTIEKIEPFGNGLINSTYKIDTDSNKYILQNINHGIFKNVSCLTENIERITNHIREKYIKGGEKDISRKTLNIIYTQKNIGYYLDLKGNYWRVFDFIDCSKTYDKIETNKHAISIGNAFAEFHELLSDLGQPPLFEVIKDFHNTAVRIENIEKAIKEDIASRKKNIEEEIRFLSDRKEEIQRFIIQGKKGKFPLRNVHQDAKLNNILFDKNTNDILCVIDLDTTMQGYVCYDFGDAMRTGACTTKEDEKDVSKVDFDLDIFKSFAKAYVNKAKKILTVNELKSLAFGIKLLTYEQAVRFLTDYLQGDIYYKIEYPEHNLVRARTQIKLLQKIEEKYTEIQEYILMNHSI